ncbi:MAG: hypothetical protein U0Z75_08870 [Deinococcaceae bacterium]
MSWPYGVLSYLQDIECQVEPPKNHTRETIRNAIDPQDQWLSETKKGQKKRTE